jgi:hypothetical protein
MISEGEQPMTSIFALLTTHEPATEEQKFQRRWGIGNTIEEISTRSGYVQSRESQRRKDVQDYLDLRHQYWLSLVDIAATPAEVGWLGRAVQLERERLGANAERLGVLFKTLYPDLDARRTDPFDQKREAQS